ncbi:UvrD-helicase domain-containing protein [Pseudomonas sp. DE0157]|uniref:UvrD-helicase domain-containing protein n=1 Tax=Pseudomonas sp. DE0157 TaxID=2584952 RepID=UPI00119ECF3C|nr:UvrD-helicase domain-containing protein [Pseudomonas sp. DE0157]
MANELWIAGAGSGKTHSIVSEAIEAIGRGERVLVVTYTTNNQAELRSRFAELHGGSSDRFVVKGLYSFYLEDMIRPYQRVIFQTRIATTLFNTGNPHQNSKTRRTIPGRSEFIDGVINPLHYLSACHTKAHTSLLGKLACQVAKLSKDAPAKRLAEIYDRVYFDEVQDLVGWDYQVIKSLNKAMPRSLRCVGDFRQTIYDTAYGQKAPRTADEKLNIFLGRLRFQRKTLKTNRRCIQEICDLGDTVHYGIASLYEKTESAVKVIPEAFKQHLGVYVVRQSEVGAYLQVFQPMVLKWRGDSGLKFLPPNTDFYTFGKSKGLGFDRVLVLPTANFASFLIGDQTAFDADSSDEARNKLYVAITRARYSIGFVVEDKVAENWPFPIWMGGDQPGTGES